MANLRGGTGITFDGATGNFNALGIGTVNIDSGIGAAVFAYLICNSLHRWLF